jgi:hypothetical protein
MDGPAKILKENRTGEIGPSPAETAVTEFRVRCIQPLAPPVIKFIWLLLAGGALLAKRALRRITRAGWIFWGVVLAPVLIGIAVA